VTLRAQAIRGLKWQAVEIAGRQLLSLVVFSLLARLLDPAAFGLVGMVGVYLLFVGMFVDQGFGTAIIQRNDLRPQHLDSAFWFNLVCGGSMCGLTVMLAGPIATIFAEPQLKPLLRWASLGLVLGALSGVHAALFARDMDFRRPALRTLVANLAGGSVGVSIALGGHGVWALVGQQLAAGLAGTAFTWWASTWRPRFRFSLHHLRDLLRVSGSVFATGALWLLASRADHFFIGRGLGSAVLGQYIVGGKLPEVARMGLQTPLGSIAMPAFSRMQNDHARMRTAVCKAVALSSLVIFPAFLGLAATAPTLITLVFGQSWAATAPILRWLAIYQLVATFFVYCQPAVLASGGLKGYILINLSCALGAVTASWVGASIGVDVVAWALTVNLFLTGLFALFFLQRRIGLTPWMYLRPCLGPLGSAMAMMVAVLYVQSLSTARLSLATSAAMQIAIGFFVYSVFIWVFAKEAVLELLATMRVAMGERTVVSTTARTGP